MCSCNKIGLWFDKELFSAEAITNTPRRIEEMLEEFKEYREWDELEKGKGIFEIEGYNDLVVMTDIDTISYCVTGKTRIRMGDGTTKYARDVSEGDEILTIDPKTRRLVKAKVVKIFRREVDELVRIRTKFGKVATMSLEHPVYVVGKGFVEAKEVKIGDKVLINNFYANSERVGFDRTKKYEFGYVLGALQSDGCIWRNRIRLVVKSREFALKFVRCFEAVFGKTPRIRRMKKKSSYTGKIGEYYEVTVVSGAIVRFLISVIGNVRHKEQRVPDIVKRDEEVLRGYIDGYVDGDGHIEYDGNRIRRVAIFSYNTEFLRELASIFGRSPIKINSREIGFVVPVRWYRGEEKLGLKGFEEIPLSIEVIEDEVVEITRRKTPNKKYVVYNFEVEGQHTFLAGDILTHNCEHHCMPMIGVTHVAYLPNGYVIGLSKIIRTVWKFAMRPQLQERMTKQIADYLYEHIPKVMGVMVIQEMTHYCYKWRGIKTNARTVTSAIRGEIPKEEVLELLKIRRRR